MWTDKRKVPIKIPIDSSNLKKIKNIPQQSDAFLIEQPKN